MRFPGLEELALAGGLAYAVVGVFGLVLGWPGRARRAALAGVIGVVAATPWVVEARFPFHRLLAAVWAVMLGAKAFDLHVGAGRGERPGLGAVLAFLPNPA